jgi:hypothetical protein
VVLGAITKPEVELKPELNLATAVEARQNGTPHTVMQLYRKGECNFAESKRPPTIVCKLKPAIVWVAGNKGL